ncbi:type IX secretion system sortase PorU [Microscilla marina]|uniref:Fjo24 n=1 Tax=Microscilla marina ATCC 23134 TaxID=313606 RepID=A1ZVJ9_MICM2|nr:type IX secretion system sortase PorU [Microscilla marina]EAY25542.1 Fjo24 [Microscilla marina ATCC 23134]
MKYITSLIFACLLLFQHPTQAQNFASSSVLGTGTWYKIGTTQQGIYKIDYNFLKDAGVDVDNINPRNIQLYGNVGGMLPQSNSASRVDDLQENSIWVAGQDDGNFDANDYILFYAQGAVEWTYNATNKLFEHTQNIYSDSVFCFLTIGSNEGKRVQSQENLSGTTQTLTTYDDYQVYEKDERTILEQGSGREWYGEVFDFETNQSFTFDTPGLLANAPLTLTSFVMGRSALDTKFSVSLNGVTLGTQSIAAQPTGTYDVKGINNVRDFTLNTSQLSGLSQLTIDLLYDKNGGSSSGYLNYLRVNYQRQLQLYNNQTTFRAIASLEQPLTAFSVANVGNGAIVWDISNPLHPVNQPYTLSGSNAVFGASTATALKQFVVFQGSDFPTPESVQTLPNQNLHALLPTNLVIIVPEVFLSEAERLAAFRRTNDGLSVTVVKLSQVYNEFSSGKQDVTALRDFARMLYLRDSQVFKYLLLFGDASFDYKDRVANNTNFVPIYESRESLHPILSHSSDDYFGFLEASEGEWTETSLGDHTLEIGIGRLPVKTLEEAANVVTKLIGYANNQSNLGSWRNRVVFVADDGDVNIHQLDADVLAEDIRNNHKNFNVSKLFLDAFEQVSTPNGELAPTLKEALTQNVEKGALIVNYTGHGGEIGWAEEKLLNVPQINDWENYHNLPLFVTATCEFGRYDDPLRVAGAEYILLNPKGGGIGLITTTRPVYSSTNFLLSKAFYAEVFKPIDGAMPRLGDLMIKTKNNSLNGAINRNFALLGDPSLRLAYPKHKVAVTKITNANTGQVVNTISALDKVTVEGEVTNAQDILLDGFEGVLDITIFDKAQELTTLGTESSRIQFKAQNNKIFVGKASVKAGKFTFTFIVPKDIDYKFGEGKWSFYAQANDGVNDAQGAKTDVIIGGTSASITPDDTPPAITLFMNDETFVNGGVVQPSATLIAKLSDENGLNIAQTGVGHEMTAVLDGDLENPWILNDFYEGNLDTYQEGVVQYPVRDLAKGKHTVVVKVWDTHNNSSEASIDFVVTDNAVMAINEVMNYPNPFNQATTFRFDHNRAGEALEVTIQIYNRNGQHVKKLQYTTSKALTRFEGVWDGLDKQGKKIPQGVYVYKITARSVTDGAEEFVVRRLVVLD